MTTPKANEDLVGVAVRAFVVAGIRFRWSDIEAATNLVGDGNNKLLPVVAANLARALGCQLRTPRNRPASFTPPNEGLAWTPNHERRRESYRRSARRRRKRWTEAGLCPRCGKRPPPLGFKTCEECRRRSRTYHRRWLDHAVQ